MFRKTLDKVKDYRERINHMSKRKKIICLIGLCIVFPEEMIVILISYKLFKTYKTYKELRHEILLLKIANNFLQKENNELRQGIDVYE